MKNIKKRGIIGIIKTVNVAAIDFLRTQIPSHLTPTQETRFAAKPFQPEEVFQNFISLHFVHFSVSTGG